MGAGMGLRSVAGRHVVITGGSSGIGLACAMEAAREGAHVTLLARDRTRLERAKAAVKDCSEKAACVAVETQAVDITDKIAIQMAVREIFSRRPIDVFICNAGIVKTGYFEACEIEDIESQVRTNLMGTIYPLHALLPLMKQRSHASPGHIVIMSSLSALSFWYGAAVYTATKYAQRGLAETLMAELLPYNINVSIIFPSFTETPLLDEAELGGSNLNKMMKIASAYDRSKVETPEHIAKCTMTAVKRGTYFVTTQMPLGGFLQTLSRGLFPASTWLGAITEGLLASPLRFASILISHTFKRKIVRAFHEGPIGQ